MSTHADPIPDEVILAALDRAVRQRLQREEVSKSQIYGHLAISSRSGAARHVHRRLAALEAAGLLRGSRRNGLAVFGLTSAGDSRLRDALRVAEVVLPESPQHRQWRHARSLAGQEIGRFRHDFWACLMAAIALLDADSSVASDAFFELVGPLRFQCQRLGSALYCLAEWAEPDDETADVDEFLKASERELSPDRRTQLSTMRRGRRNTWQWSPTTLAERGRVD